MKLNRNSNSKKDISSEDSKIRLTAGFGDASASSLRKIDLNSANFGQQESSSRALPEVTESAQGSKPGSDIDSLTMEQRKASSLRRHQRRSLRRKRFISNQLPPQSESSKQDGADTDK